MKEMISSLLFLFGIAAMIYATTASALPPIKIIEETNLEANIILVGEVLGVTRSSTQAYFELKVIHVIKGFAMIKEGDQIKVSFKPLSSDMSGIERHQTGTRPVTVEVGQLVVGYINPSKAGAEFFEPQLQGLSIIPLENR